MPVLVAAALVITFLLGPGITGLFSYEQGISHELTLSVSNSSTLALELEGVPVALVLSGNIEGEGSAQAYLDADSGRYLIANVSGGGGIVEFSGICAETCMLTNFNETNVTLSVQVEDSVLNLTELTYYLAIKEEEVPAEETDLNQPLYWDSPLSSFSIEGDTRISLDEHFKSAEGLELIFLTTSAENVITLIEGNELVVLPEEGFAGERTITVIASDGENTARQEITLIVLSSEPPVLIDDGDVEEPSPEENITEEILEPAEEEQEPAQIVQEVGAKVKDNWGREVGEKIEDDESFETFFTFVGIVGDKFNVTFFHNSTTAQPVWVEGDVIHTITNPNPLPNETITALVDLVDGRVPKFRLHIGSESEVFDFGEDEGPPPMGTQGEPHIQDFPILYHH